MSPTTVRPPSDESASASPPAPSINAFRALPGDATPSAPRAPDPRVPDGTDGARIVSHDVESALGIGESKGRVGFLRRPLRWLLPALLIVAGALYLALRHRSTPLRYQTVNARRGDLTASVIATGTLAALDTVVVGTEVSGVVDVVAVDYNDHVRRGQTLAVVNTDQLQAQIRQSEAAFQATKATAQQMAATLAEIRPQAVRAESLFRSNFIARQDLESAQASLARAVAAEANARALVAASGAALQAQRTILRKATIRSPITGVVLQREIEPGRTVAASFQTPVLFVLAADLKRMTLALDIDEADVGQVQAGQRAEFTVDAYPDRVFAATVHSVRNAARTVEGVVTYQAILDVANPDLALRPGMTATSTITAAQVRDALLVPNAALRYSPLTDSSALPSAAPTSGPRTRAAHQLWVLRDGKPVAIPVSVRMTDGQWTELTEGAVAPGTPLITGVMSANASKTTDSSSAPRSSTPMRFPHGS